MRAHFTDRNVQRVLLLAVFLASLWFFRHLALLFVFFVVFERVIGTLAEQLSTRAGVKFKYAVLLVILLFVGVAAGGVWFGVATVLKKLPEIREGFETIGATIRNSELYHRYGHVAGERVLEQGRHHVGDALGYAAHFGKEALYVFIGLIFAVVFLLEREELEAWRESMPLEAPPRVLLRYYGHVADAVAITLKLQVIVAIVNACLTLPVLLYLRLPGIPALVAMMIGTGLVPVVGSPVAGAVLMTLAYVTRGPTGLIFFIVTTFLLHKIESYYLTPRLTAKHVKLPGFVIILSLVLFEHAFGLIGLFLSFPSLYVAAKIREGWRDPSEEARDEEQSISQMRKIYPRLSSIAIKAAPPALDPLSRPLTLSAARARAQAQSERTPREVAPDGSAEGAAPAPPVDEAS